ncbi:ThuA domain-containing protein [Butyrivibrio sp. AE3006]|uniref:ThuA domain-containing protein n=1 Tax=Butyrivibrio sp. AE3006 TaxID=1280673 RepID=UPI000421D76D|nr:ThuA domain-containing protein [Butyrivibrio sp. AE3006]
MIRVTIWNEYKHEQELDVVKKVYPDGIHGCIKAFLSKEDDFEVRTATFIDEEHGLTEEVLDNTDVLIYWSHALQDEFSDEVADRIKRHVLSGMGLIALHSAHYSKMLRLLMGTTMTLKWKHDESEKLWCTAPTHPIAKGLPECIDIPEEEMYGESFDIPKPDDVVFTGWFSNGYVFRSGCTFTRGKGKIFYFQPGHETCPTYYIPEIQRIIVNAVRYCNPDGIVRSLPQNEEIKG